jgi:hypothetical protein
MVYLWLILHPSGFMESMQRTCFSDGENLHAIRKPSSLDAITIMPCTTLISSPVAIHYPVMPLTTEQVSPDASRLPAGGYHAFLGIIATKPQKDKLQAFGLHAGVLGIPIW